MKTLLPLLFVSLFMLACSAPKIAPVAAVHSSQKIDYIKDVKPILDKRCVSCHSCYNAPCQAKFEAYEGVSRGGSKIEVYNAMRLSAIEPTRLFIDAQNTQQWREKGFFSLTDSADTNATHIDSIMAHLLHQKKLHPEVVGEYSPESDTLHCPKDKSELEEYIDAKPYHAMPYGFPALSESEYTTLMAWLTQGAKGADEKTEQKLTTPSPNATNAIQKYEAFFNNPDPKYQMSARYLYEHLYLAHIYFDQSDFEQSDATREFFELVRSYTPPGEPIEIIPTLRPFDDPGVEKFYYRLQKIHSTIVHKTHMTFKFDTATLERFRALFIEPEWDEEPHIVSYDASLSANPFVAFRQIPPRSRYQFLLDNSHYIIMTFIRGPVCRGQMALNVIHDHFWVMFRDPEYDVSVLYPEFINSQSHNLEMPIANVSERLLKTFSDEYKERYEHYYHAKKEIISRKYPNGFELDSIWAGERAEDAPMLSVYRHFDSASIHKGALGSEPRTLWVIDYAQFERIYYSLVAGYDVFGNISHQTNIRRYMDFLRMEGELNYLEYMPLCVRHDMLKSWYIGDSSIDDAKYLHLDRIKSGINYDTTHYKHEFLSKLIEQRFLPEAGIAFDSLNYRSPHDPIPQMPKKFNSYDDFITAAKTLTLPGTGFITRMTDSGANNILLRINLADGSYIVKNLIINRWHDNVNSLFNGKEVLDASKDSMDILDANIGSYPNAFCIVDERDLVDFLALMKNMSGSDEEYKRLESFFVSRSNPDFWEIYDWFVDYFYTIDPINAGLYDLNRYAKSPWGSY